MSLRSDLTTYLKNALVTCENKDYNLVDDILKLFETRIDRIIEIDTKIVNKERGTKEGKIAAQASKNTLILVKEMLKN